jgi:DNA-binding CsgD family transcriptional regulator
MIKVMAKDFHLPAELVSSLLDGAFETPLWRTFLEQLRGHVAADWATLIFRPPGRPLGEALHLFAGDRPRATVDQMYRKYLPQLDLLSDFAMEADRAYRFEELYPPRNARHLPFYEEVVIPSGVKAACLLRVVEATGVDAWLVVSSRGGELDPAASRLLEAIAPVLRGVLRSYVALEHVRFSADVTSKAMRLLHFGWLALDEEGHVVDLEPEAQSVLSRSKILRLGSNRRLSARPPELENAIFKTIAALAKDPKGHPRAFILKKDPWLDMLLVPATHKRLSAHPRAVVIAYVHGDSWRTSDRCEQLSQLFGLSPGESRLALALSRGLSMSEAASKLELKVGTVRKYSKSIYAKLGARGLPDLVRIVLRSILAIAPDR